MIQSINYNSVHSYCFVTHSMPCAVLYGAATMKSMANFCASGTHGLMRSWVGIAENTGKRRAYCVMMIVTVFFMFCRGVLSTIP